MKLIATCKSCAQKIKLKNSAIDRVELSRELGEEFTLSCNECLKKNTYNVNDVSAEERKLILALSFFLLIFGTGIIFYLLKDYLLMPNNPHNILSIGSVILIPSFIYTILIKQERDNVRLFNHYYRQ